MGQIDIYEIVNSIIAQKEFSEAHVNYEARQETTKTHTVPLI